MKKIIIIGAGISGLSAAWRLSEAGYTTHVLESDKQIGGLAKSIKIDDYILDIGPGAGVHGGEIVAQGLPNEIAKNKIL